MDEYEDKPDKPATQHELSKLIAEVNVADTLTEDQLTKIGHDVKKGYEQDCESRKDWEEAIEGWTKLAKQTVEPRSYPWPNASNIKYPLLATAAMQFAARAYPSLVPSNGKVVSSQIIGKDPDGQKYERAQRVSTYMSYQLMEEMKGWEEDMDRMLIMLPIVGVLFKKTYWDSLDKKNCSKLILPKNLVVDYWTTSLLKAERISEVIELSPRLVKERQMNGLFLDVDLSTPIVNNKSGKSVKPTNLPPVDDTTPHVLIEQHTYLDLDEDDYKEPYIITIHRDSGKVLRITANFDERTMKFKDDGTLIKIESIAYYTKFGFIPNPDGGFYDIGFGTLLGPLNESVNTLINQLVDAGTLSNLQAGFIGKGLRIKMGETRFQPGEWKAVNASGEDIKKSIFPLPTASPSDTLFKLMGSLITSGKELASVAEIFTGKMPGQNTPATTTMATVEQGMKVFTAVYKRLFRSLAEEFAKLYRLNSVYANPQEYVAVIDTQVGQDDFNQDDFAIVPGADPTATSQQEKLQKAQGLMELLQTGMLDPVKVIQRVLDAQEQPNWQELMNAQVAQTGQPPPPPPDPKVMALQAKMQSDQQAAQQSMQIKGQAAELDSRSKEQKMAMEAMSSKQKIQDSMVLANVKAASQQHADEARIAGAVAQAHVGLVQSEQSHQQKMVHQEQAAQIKKSTRTK